MKIGNQPKTYKLSVEYKSFWPSFVVIDWHYSNLMSVLEHAVWLGEQIKGQNGEGAVRKNVIMSFYLEEVLCSKARNKKHPPLDKFVAPEGRNKPAGGKERPLEFGE